MLGLLLQSQLTGLLVMRDLRKGHESNRVNIHQAQQEQLLLSLGFYEDTSLHDPVSETDKKRKRGAIKRGPIKLLRGPAKETIMALDGLLQIIFTFGLCVFSHEANKSTDDFL